MTSSNQNSDYVSALSCGSLTVREPIKIAQGVSEWKTFTPVLSTGALGTGGVTSFRYRITGQTLQLCCYHSQTSAGTTGSGSYVIALPTGCIPSDVNYAVGNGHILGATKSVVVSVVNSVLGISLYISDPTSTTPAIALWGSGSDAEFRLGASGAVAVTFSATIPLNVTSPILRQ